ncbi:MAG: hypothetical protein ACREHC_00205 [Candidatus Levyibacteriota bacterium]
MAEKSVSINLLPQKGESFLNQLLNWILTVGRLLIILTEMVALATFIYRFSLDMENVDLHDKINGENLIAVNFKDSEMKFRDIQDRLATIKRYNSIGATTTGIFADITKLGQDKVTFKDLLVSTDNAKIEVQAPSVTALTQFTNSLRNYAPITALSIDRVATSPSTAVVTVSMTATLKPEAFAQSDKQTQPGIQSNATILSQ